MLPLLSKKIRELSSVKSNSGCEKSYSFIFENLYFEIFF
tara:strand:- start:290 stop:406 length:117 start_codon:yes stop_codon:yes gene_type:complete